MCCCSLAAVHLLRGRGNTFMRNVSTPHPTSGYANRGRPVVEAAPELPGHAVNIRAPKLDQESTCVNSCNCNFARLCNFAEAVRLQGRKEKNTQTPDRSAELCASAAPGAQAVTAGEAWLLNTRERGAPPRGGATWLTALSSAGVAEALRRSRRRPHTSDARSSAFRPTGQRV